MVNEITALVRLPPAAAVVGDQGAMAVAICRALLTPIGTSAPLPPCS
jgi:hypothetical protein